VLKSEVSIKVNMNNTQQSAGLKGVGWFKLLLKDPLLHFVILGAVLFSAYMVFNDEVETLDSKKIVIDQSSMNRLANAFERSWRRKPTKTEMDRLIQEHLKEEIL